MIRYMAITDDFDKAEKKLRESIWFTEAKPPETPYLKLAVKIVGREGRYSSGKSVLEKTLDLFGFKITIERESERSRK